MTPDRPRGGDAPSAEEIRAARAAAGLTQTEAAALVRGTLRAWQDWEGGQRRMHAGLWELFGIKAGRKKQKPRRSGANGADGL